MISKTKPQPQSGWGLFDDTGFYSFSIGPHYMKEILTK